MPDVLGSKRAVAGRTALKGKWPDPRDMPTAFLRALGRFNDKGGWIMSSHVAMSLMLSLFPFIIFVVGLSGYLARDVPVEDVLDLMFGAWPDEIAGPIESEVRSVLTGASSRLLTVSGLLAIYFASNGVDAVRVAVTRAYHDTDPRGFLQARILCIVLVLIGAASLLAIAVLGIVLPVTFNLLGDAVPEEFRDWARTDHMTLAFTTIVPVLAVTVVHLWLPGVRHPLRHVLPGIILTVILWAVSSWGFSIYMSKFASYGATYAGLAGAMAGLIFLYLVGAILILGAEFNGALLYPDDPGDTLTGQGDG